MRRDLGICIVMIEHHVPLSAGGYGTFSFHWENEEVATHCRIVRSRLERFSVGSDGLTVYHSGLEFENVDAATREQLKGLIGRFITRALEEQRLNARGVMPQHHVEKMPIFSVIYLWPVR